jgi:putative copper export protein
MNLWIRQHTVGWQIWVPITLAFAAYLVWAEPRPKARLFLPSVFLGFLILTVVINYLKSDWHLLFNRPDLRLWLGGLLAMVAHAALPLSVATSMNAIRFTKSLKEGQRFSLLAGMALLVTVTVGYYVTHYIQVVVRGG